MESFLVAARRYRPQNFESVVGQDAVVKALEYAPADTLLCLRILIYSISTL